MKWALALIALAVALQCLGVHAATAKGKVAATVADDYMAQDTLQSIKSLLQIDLDTVQKNQESVGNLFEQKLTGLQKQVVVLNDKISSGKKQEKSLTKQMQPLRAITARIQQSIDVLNAKLVGGASDVSSSTRGASASLDSTSDDLVLLSSSSQTSRRTDKSSVSRRMQRVQNDVEGALLKRFTRMLESLQSIRSRNLSPADTGRELEKLLQGSALLEVVNKDNGGGDSGTEAATIIDSLLSQAIVLFKSANPEKLSSKSREKICGDIISQLRTIIDGYNTVAPLSDRVSVGSADDVATIAPGSAAVQSTPEGGVIIANIEPATLAPAEEASHESLKADAENLVEHNEDLKAKLQALVQAQHDALEQQQRLKDVQNELDRRQKIFMRIDTRKVKLEEKQKQIDALQKQIDEITKELEHDEETLSRLLALGSNLKKLETDLDATFGEILDTIQTSVYAVGKLDKAVGTNADIQDYGGFVVQGPTEAMDSDFSVASVLSDSFSDVSLDDTDITL